MNKLLISIFFIFICIFFIYYIRVYEHFETPMYRLGDMFRIKEGSNSRYNQKIGLNYHLKHFPNSIATEYMLKTKNTEDYNQLLNIINKRKPIFKNHNYAIIHLRIGDVIDSSDKSLNEMLNKYTLYKNIGNYVKPLDYYNRIINTIKKNKITKILLIGGFHNGRNHQKSYEYVKQIQNHFKNNGFECYTRINSNADEDFLIMCYSKYFIPSGGGFSNIIKNIVNMKGGKVIEI